MLYDDRVCSPGTKLNDADLIGIYNQVIISPRTLKENKIEFRTRINHDSKIIDVENIKNHLTLKRV